MIILFKKMYLLISDESPTNPKASVFYKMVKMLGMASCENKDMISNATLTNICMGNGGHQIQNNNFHGTAPYNLIYGGQNHGTINIGRTRRTNP